MSGGFLSRFRIRRDAEGAGDDHAAAHEATHVVQDFNADLEMPDKVDSSDLPAEGNDVAMEELQLSHEGLTLEEEAQAENVSQKFTMFKEDGTPLRAQVDAGPVDPDAADSLESDSADADLGDQSGMAIEKIEIAVEQVKRAVDEAPDDLTQGDTGEDAATGQLYEGLITKTTIPAMDPEDVEPPSTLQPLNETEGDGLSLLTTNLHNNLDDVGVDAGDDDPDMDD